MTDTDKDPMLFGSAEEQAAYRSNITDIMKQAIEEDRAERRIRPAQLEYPATIIGATGLTKGLNQSL